ncbi:hypothetical protein HYP06_gp069 [Vibrio phage vB_VspP_pVa5]|uniref:Uncharacterized protein n=1 Tax=Vibrio phage vB_VspP_pVa5 TaxID=1913109 RepID=A0A1J0GV90_9CAUD|nr:hypothetical protein HYP06_gp069 [Vibrio phage vB_VspP_pVa5]APC46094.1 hypothetical protein vBVspPpVa5_0104 [Vibrio phage vB_VspP_pVa5]
MPKLNLTRIEYITALVTILCVIGAITSGLYTYELFMTELENYREDAKCIAHLVSQGIERQDIALIDRVCVVDEDIYFKNK